MRFVNTLEFSEVPRFGITKAPKNTLEWYDWWVEQKKRCIHGYSVGGVRITGPHYWYLNFWKIRGINRLLNPEQKGKRLISPRFLELDYDFFIEWERCRKENKNFGIFKKRQCGVSEKVAAIVGHEFSFFPASQSIILAGEEKYAENTTRFVKRGLNGLAGTEFYKHRSPDQLDTTIARMQVENDLGQKVWIGYMSELHMLTAKINAEVASRFSPSLAVFEEIGKFKLLSETYGYLKPSQEDQGQKTGWSIFLGTSTDVEEGIASLTDIVFNPARYDCMEYDNVYSEGYNQSRICYFIPGQRYYLIDNEGNDLIAESLAKMDANREKAALNPDPSELIEEVIWRPKNPEEAIMHFKGGRFDGAKLNKQRARIVTHKDLQVSFRADAEWIYDGKPTAFSPEGKIIGIHPFERDKNGPFLISHLPVLDDRGKPVPGCYGGTDSYDKDEALTSHSMGSTSIFDGINKMFAARCTMRPPSAPIFYENSAKLCYAYGATNLIEWSNTRIFDWYVNRELFFLLKERPKLAYANVKNSKVNNKYGVDPGTKEAWILGLQSYIYNYADRIYDLEALKKLVEYHDDVNCDVTVGMSLAYINYMDTIRYLHKPKDKKEQKKMWGFQLKSGVITQQFDPEERAIRMPTREEEEYIAAQAERMEKKVIKKTEQMFGFRGLKRT